MIELAKLRIENQDNRSIYFWIIFLLIKKIIELYWRQCRLWGQTDWAYSRGIGHHFGWDGEKGFYSTLNFLGLELALVLYFLRSTT